MFEPTIIKYYTQLLFFISSISPNFEVCKDPLSIETLFSCPRGEDMFVSVKNACIRNRLNLKNLRTICTDGALAIMGNTQGLIAKFSEFVSKEYNNK